MLIESDRSRTLTWIKEAKGPGTAFLFPSTGRSTALRAHQEVGSIGRGLRMRRGKSASLCDPANIADRLCMPCRRTNVPFTTTVASYNH